MLVRLAGAVLVVAVGIGLGVVERDSVRAQEASEDAHRTGDVIVRFQEGASFATVVGALEEAETTPLASTSGSRLVLLAPEPGQSVDDAVAALEADPAVEFAEPDVVVSIADTTPADPLYASNQWNLPQIGLPAAWDRTTGNTSVVIAIIDTGVDGTHPELSGRLVAGRNVIAGTSNAADDHFHGTFVAGVAAATANNGQGMAGVCWQCKIMPVKVLDQSGNGSMFHAAVGVDWAVANGADVINMSLGGGSGLDSLQTAVTNAWNANVVVVAATGNNNGPVLYPAAYATSVAVGANTEAGVRASFSNFGAEIDVMAPGEGVVGPLCNCAAYSGGYGSGSGTSFAAPHVAGLIGLMIANGMTDNDAIVDALVDTATDMSPIGFDDQTGHGRIDADGATAPVGPAYAVTWDADSTPPTMAPMTTTAVSLTLTNTGSFTWPSAGANKVNVSYHWRTGACGGTASAVWNGLRTSLPGDVATGATVTALSANVATPSSPGTYCLVWDLVHEGVAWFSLQGAATLSKTVVVAAAYGVNWGVESTPSTMTTSTNYPATLSFTNTGTLTWPSAGANRVNLSYHWRNGACPGTTSAVYDGLRTNIPADVATGGGVTNLAATVRAPSTAGTYCLVYDLVREGVAWFSTQGAATKARTVTVVLPAAQYGVSWGADNTPATMTMSSNRIVSISFTNSGALTWASSGANRVNFSYHWRNGACGGSSSAIWNGVRTGLPADVTSGGVVTNLSATIAAPGTAGTYCLVYDLVREGITWFSAQSVPTLSRTVSVGAPQYAVTWGMHSTPPAMAAGSLNPVTISFTNAGTLTWEAASANPVNLSYHWRNGACGGASSAIWNGARTGIPGDVASGGVVTDLAASVAAPAAPGTYCLVYDLVREGIAWFSSQGAATASQTVTVS